MFTLVLYFIVLGNIIFYGICASKRMDYVYKIAFWFAWTVLVLGALIGTNLGLFGGRNQLVDLPGWFLVSALFAPFVTSPFCARLIDGLLEGTDK
jgi:uncharacterized membrane protein AbrB (regulator of aidB expression)